MKLFLPSKSKKKAFIVVLSLFSLFCLPVYSLADKSIENLQSEIDAIDLQIKFLKIKVDDQKKKSRNLEDRIENAKQQVKDLEAQIEQLNKNQEEIMVQIQKLEVEKSEVKKQHSELLSRFRNRLVHLHKIKQGTLISSVLLAKNINSFLNRYQMVKYLLESDKSLIEELKSENEKLNNITQKLKEKSIALEAGKEEITEKQKKFFKEQASLKLMLNTILLEKNQFLKKEKTLVAARKQLEKKIQETAKITAKPDFEKELDDSSNTKDSSKKQKDKQLLSVSAVPAVSDAPLNNNNEKKANSNDDSISVNSSEVAKIMNFIWPIDKNLRGQVIEKGDDNSSALLITPIADAEVVAVAKGKVLYKGNISGLGDVIILGHQRGFSSVYAKLDEVWVGLNEVVEKGDVIGKIIGGNNTLHFEIRFGGKKKPPLSFLPQ